jgi:hypothetical protein
MTKSIQTPPFFDGWRHKHKRTIRKKKMDAGTFILRQAVSVAAFVLWMLVEITEKMGTASTCWVLASIFSIPLVYAAFRVTSKIGMVVVLVLAGGLTFLMTLASLQEAFSEDQFSQEGAEQDGTPMGRSPDRFGMSPNRNGINYDWFEASLGQA